MREQCHDATRQDDRQTLCGRNTTSFSPFHFGRRRKRIQVKGAKPRSCASYVDSISHTSGGVNGVVVVGDRVVPSGPDPPWSVLAHSSSCALHAAILCLQAATRVLSARPEPYARLRSDHNPLRTNRLLRNGRSQPQRAPRLSRSPLRAQIQIVIFPCPPFRNGGILVDFDLDPI